jgi:hypothetical protein
VEHEQQPPRRARSAFEDLRRAAMARLKGLGFRTTGGVARVLVGGNGGVIQFQKGSASAARATTFTVGIGVVVGALLPPGSKKPLSHCSDNECHAHVRIGRLREPGADVWWTLAADRPDAAVAGDVLERLERDAVPFLERALAALGEAAPGTPREELLRRIAAARAAGGPAGP